MILVVDANNLLHRILHVPALARLVTRSGVPVGGVFGSIRVFKRTIEDFAVDGAVAVWDSTHSKRRKEIYPEYKGGRTRDPAYHSLFVSQKERLQETLTALGVCQLQVPGREADDVIFNIVEVKKYDWLIQSEDRDMLQAVAENVSVWRPITQANETKDPVDAEGNLKHLVRMANFVEYTGMRHGHYQFWKALTGDSSDNIPGVLGDKAALVVLKNMKEPTLVGLFDALTACTELPRFSRYCKNALDNWPDIIRNHQLLDLSQEVLEPVEMEAVRSALFRPKPPLSEMMVAELMSQLEFRSILNNLAQWCSPFRRIHAIQTFD